MKRTPKVGLEKNLVRLRGFFYEINRYGILIFFKKQIIIVCIEFEKLNILMNDKHLTRNAENCKIVLNRTEKLKN